MNHSLQGYTHIMSLQERNSCLHLGVEELRHREAARKGELPKVTQAERYPVGVQAQVCPKSRSVPAAVPSTLPTLLHITAPPCFLPAFPSNLAISICQSTPTDHRRRNWLACLPLGSCKALGSSQPHPHCN